MTICSEGLFIFFHSEIATVFVFEVYLLYGSCLNIHSVGLCLFIGELSALILNDNIE